MDIILYGYHDATEYHRTDWLKKRLRSNKVSYQINNIRISPPSELLCFFFVSNYIQNRIWNLFLSISIYKQSRNTHSLKSHTEQTLNLLPFLEVVCSTAESRILYVYFRNFLVIIHELKIKGLFILRQNKVNQNRMYLLSYFPLYVVHSNATVNPNFVNV